MRTLIASPLGLLIGLSLGALGGGGSILAVPALVFAAGETPTQATTTSLVLVAITAAIGLVPHWRDGRVRVAAGLTFGAAGVGGSFVGSRLNRAVDPDVLLLAFSGLMLVAAWAMWRKANRPTHAPTPRPVGAAVRHSADDAADDAAGQRISADTVRLAAKVLAAGTVVGLLTGFFGVGGGFVVVPALVLALDMAMPEAVGTSLLVIVVNTVVALGMRWGSGTVHWAAVVPFGIAAVVGVLIGTRVARTRDPRVLQRWFVALLVLVAAATAVRSVVALTG